MSYYNIINSNEHFPQRLNSRFSSQLIQGEGVPAA